MATAEELIRRRLLESTDLKAVLARYLETPAVFLQAPPADTDDGWDGATQYPRVNFVIDKQAEAEHESTGTLHVDIECAETGALPEDIEPLIRRALAGVFYAPDEGSVFALAWGNTSTFQGKSQALKESLIVGVTIEFSLVAFPDLEPGDPDPVAAINAYTEQWDKDITIISKAQIADFFEPTREKPAVYFGRRTVNIDRMTNTVTWLNAVLVVHFFAPDLQDRVQWIEQFAQQLALDTEVMMLDGSPMFITNIKGDAERSDIAGQLLVKVQYGLLRRPKYAHTAVKMSLS